MPKMNRLTTSVAIALGLAAGTAHATNGDQLLGVTAMQWGMGGAVVAAPQDAATIFTNPAGLGELGIETIRFDLSPGFLNPPRSVNNMDSDSDLFFLPSGAIAYKVNDRLFLGLGLGAQSGMGVDVSDIVAAMAGSQPVVTTKGLFRIAPSVALKVNKDLTVGASLNIGYQSLALYNASYQFPQNQQFGFGASLGAIYHVNDQVQVGATWTSEMDVSEHEFNTTSGKFKMDMDAPQSLALGVAYKPAPGLLVEADVKWIDFSATNDSVAIVQPAGYAGAIPTAANFGWDDQVVVALGIQKELNPSTTVRMGLNYGKSPIEAADVNNNLGSVAIPEKHLSLGMTRKLGKNLSGSLSYTHAFENELTSSVGAANTIKIKQNVFYAQVSYSF